MATDRFASDGMFQLRKAIEDQCNDYASQEINVREGAPEIVFKNIVLTLIFISMHYKCICNNIGADVIDSDLLQILDTFINPTMIHLQ